MNLYSLRHDFQSLTSRAESVQTRLRIGTRGSALALVQTRAVIAALAKAHEWTREESAAKTEIIPIKTTGDRVQDRSLADIGGKGLFAKEIEESLLAGEIDCAVHSLKDMPATLPQGLLIDCVLPREDPRDAFISKVAASLEDLPIGAVVGTSSVRRQAFLLNTRSDLKIVNFRGNVDTRLKRISEDQVAATILALAGLKRLGVEHNARKIFSEAEMLPAVAQGAIGIELRENDSAVRTAFASINQREAALAVTLERAFLAVLDGSCKTPIAGLAKWLNPTTISFQGCVLTPDGRTRFDVTRTAAISSAKEATDLGLDAGTELLKRAGRSFFQV